MIAEQWESCKSIFEEALEYEGVRRDAFLGQACGGDPAMRKAIEALLAGHRSNTNFLEPPTGTELEPLQAILREEARGDPEWVGHYRVLERISSGGMGRIYRAVRDNGEFGQTVAVKLIKRGMDTEAVVRRFQRERQTLANLDHPYIARLIDGGNTENGLPFLVMEYVQGHLIDRYCDQQRMSVDQRLRLFLKVCSAVHYAHQNLVVHRDLKPANILVTDDGTPKLLDFGISKLLVDATSPSPVTTISSFKLMTLQYASPEQVLCETITTTSDVYSLGVILYELLTGRSPYNADSRSRQELQQFVCNRLPEKPSAVITAAICPSRTARPEKLRRCLQGDLDNIVMTALQKDPNRRYSSVQQLSDDIVRHLTGMTISARPDTLKYRVAKFIRRNTVGVVAAAVIFLSLVGGTCVALFGLLQAQAEAEKAKQLNTLVQNIIITVNPQHTGRDVTVREMLDDAAERLETELADQPEAKASLHRTLGLTYLGLGVYRSAEAHLQAALDLRRRHFGKSSLEVAESLCDLGELANTRYNPKRATPLFRESLGLYRRRFGQRHPAVARSLHGLGVASYNCGTNACSGYRNGVRDQDYYQAAETALSETISILREHDQEVPALYFMDLGMALQRRKKYSAGERAYLDGIQASRRKFGNNSVAEAYIRFEYAQLLEARCEFDAAERMFREALAWQRKQLGDRHPYLALSLNRFADFLCQKLEDYEESEAIYLEALDIRGNFTDCERFRRNANKYRRRLCALYTRTGDIPKAIDVIREPTDQVLENPNKGGMKYLTLMGDAYFAGGDYSTANRYYQIVISYAETESVPRGREIVAYAHALSGAARILAAQKDLDSAESVARQSVSVLRCRLAGDDPRLADSLFVLSEVLLSQSRYEDAEAVLHECLEIRKNTFTDQHSLTTAAEQLHRQCLTIFGTNHAPMTRLR